MRTIIEFWDYLLAILTIAAAIAVILRLAGIA